jgi:hypothetical protein
MLNKNFFSLIVLFLILIPRISAPMEKQEENHKKIIRIDKNNSDDGFIKYTESYIDKIIDELCSHSPLNNIQKYANARNSSLSQENFAQNWTNDNKALWALIENNGILNGVLGRK